MLRRRAPLLPSLLAAAVAIAGCGGDDAATPGSPSFSVERRERTWIDETRPAGAAPQRALRVVFWRPQGGASRPLVLLAHGFGGLPEKFDALGAALARAGYLAAAPAFPLTNENAPGGHEGGLPDVVNQPEDLSFVLSQILAASASPDDSLSGAVDDSRIAALGHSLGGLTVIALTRKQCCRDTRLGATILVAPLAGLASAFGADPITAGPPTIILHGMRDQSIAYASSRDLYAAIAPPHLLVGVAGAGHSDLIEGADGSQNTLLAASEATVIAFLEWRFAGRLEGLQAELAARAGRGDEVESDLGAAPAD